MSSAGGSLFHNGASRRRPLLWTACGASALVLCLTTVPPATRRTHSALHVADVGNLAGHGLRARARHVTAPSARQSGFFPPNSAPVDAEHTAALPAFPQQWAAALSVLTTGAAALLLLLTAAATAWRRASPIAGLDSVLRRLGGQDLVPPVDCALHSLTGVKTPVRCSATGLRDLWSLAPVLPVSARGSRLRPLQGIVGYTDVINDLFPGVSQPADETQWRQCDVVCIDVNDLLHTAMLRANNKVQYIKNLQRSIKTVLRLTRPREYICVFIDGPASHAKMLLQRERRADSNRPDFVDGRMSSLDLTAGCELMDWLQKPLQEFLQTRYVKHYLSDLRDPGEGEIKMIKWLRDNRTQLAGKRVTIVGRDADLVVLALCALDYSRLLSLRGSAWVDIEKILKELQSWPVAHHSPRGGRFDQMPLEHHPMRLEFSAVTLMMGNDYFPSLAIRRDVLISKMTQRYKHTVGGDGQWAPRANLICTPDARLRRKGLIGFLEFVGNDGVQDDGAATDQDCQAVVEGWAWCLHMYTMGKCPAPRWHFTGRPVSAPALLSYLRRQDYDLVPVPSTEDRFVTPVVAALATLPYVGRQCVPEEFRPLFEDGSPLKDLYPTPCLVCAEHRRENGKLLGRLKALKADLASLQANADVTFRELMVQLDAHCASTQTTSALSLDTDRKTETTAAFVSVGLQQLAEARASSKEVAKRDAVAGALRQLGLVGPEDSPPVEPQETVLVAEMVDLRKELGKMAKLHEKHLALVHPRLRTLPIDRIEESVKDIVWIPNPNPYPSPADLLTPTPSSPAGPSTRLSCELVTPEAVSSPASEGPNSTAGSGKGRALGFGSGYGKGKGEGKGWGTGPGKGTGRGYGGWKGKGRGPRPQQSLVSSRAPSAPSPADPTEPSPPTPTLVTPTAD